MTDAAHLRSVIISMLGFTATEEEVLLAFAAREPAQTGSPQRWAAAPLIAHNTEFKRQQAIRLEAIPRGQTPPVFAETDHESEEVYQRYCAQDGGQVLQDCRATTAALLDGLAAIADEDLCDPARNPWLAGRQLWLQILVRGFWHPMGHLGEYYLGHGQPARACAMQAQAVALADYVGAPDPVQGMALYTLACTQARALVAEKAVANLRSAIKLNPDLRATAGRDNDLTALRDNGSLDAVFAR